MCSTSQAAAVPPVLEMWLKSKPFIVLLGQGSWRSMALAVFLASVKATGSSRDVEGREGAQTWSAIILVREGTSDDDDCFVWQREVTL